MLLSRWSETKNPGPLLSRCRGSQARFFVRSFNFMKFEHQHVVSFSGGVCSFWAAHRVIQRFGKDEVTLLFADTMIEDEDLYRFNVDAAAYFGVPITRIADGRTPWDVMRDERIVGNSRIDPYSKLLKRELLGKWMRANSVEMAATLYLGLDWTEVHRLTRLRDRKPGWTIEAPETG